MKKLLGAFALTLLLSGACLEAGQVASSLATAAKDNPGKTTLVVAAAAAAVYGAKKGYDRYRGGALRAR